MFLYGKNNGYDTIQRANSNDVVKLDGITLDDCVAFGDALFVGNDVRIELKEGGHLTVENAKTNGVVFEIEGTRYAVNSTTGEWEFR